MLCGESAFLEKEMLYVAAHMLYGILHGKQLFLFQPASLMLYIFSRKRCFMFQLKCLMFQSSNKQYFSPFEGLFIIFTWKTISEGTLSCHGKLKSPGSCCGLICSLALHFFSLATKPHMWSPGQSLNSRCCHTSQ